MLTKEPRDEKMTQLRQLEGNADEVGKMNGSLDVSEEVAIQKEKDHEGNSEKRIKNKRIKIERV